MTSGTICKPEALLMAHKRKKILFVDDDAGMLDVLRHVMGAYSAGAWEIFTAQDVSVALGILQEQKVDLAVIDIHMPLVDGIQFLSLMQRKFPDVLKVVLTGDATEQHRSTCLSSGAELFLEKPRDDGGWRTVHATLHELTRFRQEDGFQGVLRRVGLQDVLQMECLARNSSVLHISAGNVQGTVHVKDGQIVHAHCGARTGEDAFNHLLCLSGGSFDVKPYSAPPAQTISGSWEFLLMEAARKRDETAGGEASSGDADNEEGFPTPVAIRSERNTPAVVPVLQQPVEASSDFPNSGGRNLTGEGPWRPQVEELLVCSLQGEVLHEWKCANANNRIGLLDALARKARQISQGLPLGDFDRIEVNAPQTRIVAQIQADRSTFLRTSLVAGESAAGGKQP